MSDSLFNYMDYTFCPPGEGVYTVSTAKEKRQNLQAKLYPNLPVREAWRDQIKAFHQGLALIGLCCDSGGGIHRGANWGPLVLRESIYSAKQTFPWTDLGDVRVIPHLILDEYLNKETLTKCQHALYGTLEKNYPVSPLSIAYEFAKLFFASRENALITIGGDHSISYPLIKAFLEQSQSRQENVGVLHFDAHTDLLEHRLGIDICFGSWASHIIRHLPHPQALVQVGIRSSAQDRQHWEKKFSHKQIWASDFQHQNAFHIGQNILSHYQKLKIKKLYVTFDIDVLDQSYAMATGTPEPHGLGPHQVALMIDALSHSLQLSAFDIVEFAPYVRWTPQGPPEPANTLLSIQPLFNKLVDWFERRNLGHH